MLCFIFSGGRSLDWPTMAESHVKKMHLHFLTPTVTKWWSTGCTVQLRYVCFLFSGNTHDPQHCWMQKHPSPCSGSGRRAAWVAGLPSRSWKLQAQRAELLTPKLNPALLHHPWLSLAWWASLRLWLHWHVDSVMALPSKQKGMRCWLNGVNMLYVVKIRIPSPIRDQ